MLADPPIVYSREIDGLASCDLLDASARRMFEYWREKRGPRKLPARADLEPGDLREFLPDILLVDVSPEPPHFRYRLAGTRHVTARGRDPTGLAVVDAHLGFEVPGMRARVLDNYRAVVAACRPQYRDTAVSGQDNRGNLLLGGHLVARYSLFLPLAADGETVDMVLAYTRFASA